MYEVTLSEIKPETIVYPNPRLIFHHYDLHCDPLVLLSPDLFSDHLLYIFNKSEKTDFIAILLPEEFVLKNTGYGGLKFYLSI